MEKPHQLHLKNVLILENAERIELRDNPMQAYLDRFAGTGLTEFDIVCWCASSGRKYTE